MNGNDTGLPLEQFIQALQTQLDHAQAAMALKAQNMNLPLTFAVKDISLDLRAHVEMVRSEVRIRPASAGDRDTSLLRLSLSTITRPMIEENAPPVIVDRDGPSLKEVAGEDLSDEDRKKLEWAGVQTVAQLRRLQESGADTVVERVTSLPVERLRRALQRASEPMLSHVLPQALAQPDGAEPQTILRVGGSNLTRNGVPRVTIDGRPVSVVRASEHELLLAPAAEQMSGDLLVEREPGHSAVIAFDLRPYWRGPAAAAPVNGSGAEAEGKP
jgi:hypothetical protein